MSEPTLKPCPFCGSESIEPGSEAFGYGDSMPFIACQNVGCGAKMYGLYTIKSAIGRWNRRYEAKPQDDWAAKVSSRDLAGSERGKPKLQPEPTQSLYSFFCDRCGCPLSEDEGCSRCSYNW